MKKDNSHITIASGTYLPETSGQSTFSSNIHRFFNDHNWDALVVAYGKKDNWDDVKKIYIVQRTKFRYFNYAIKLRKKSRDAGLLYAQDLISSGLPAALAKKRKQKLVVRIGGDFLWEKMVNSKKTDKVLREYYDIKKGLREKLYLRFYAFVLSRCSGIIFNNELQKDLYKKHFKLDKKKITVIGNPNKLDKYISHDVKRESTIIFAGRLIPLKNIDKLIVAFKNIKDEGIKLKIIGDGPLKNELETLKGSDNRIEFVSHLVHEKMIDEIVKARILVVPSLSEMNPNVAHEAFALGTPIVLTKETGFPKELQQKARLIDPRSQKSIQEGIEFYLNENNYQNARIDLKSLSYGLSWNDVFNQHVSFFETL